MHYDTPWDADRHSQPNEVKQLMIKGEINIIEENCRGCGLCERFCLQGGILVMSGDKFSTTGVPLPSFVNPDECNACGNCRAMCPHFAIEVYKHIDNTGAVANNDSGASPGTDVTEGNRHD
jgi:2-oxoglutarate ferredoxin oxidoreductase subunit delta